MIRLRHYLYYIKYMKAGNLWLPFKVYTKMKLLCRPTAQVFLDGRVYFGNEDSRKAIVSRNITNIYFGYDSQVRFGKGIVVGPGVNILVKNKAEFSVGDDTYFTADMHIEAVNNISIGCDCAISWGVTIIDDDHHQILNRENSKNDGNKVEIGDHVWIGCNVIILKNTRIGSGSVVAAGSVVRGEYPANSLIAGNPAKIISPDVEWKR